MSEIEEMVPGMREQGKGQRIYVEHEFARLRTILVGDPSSIYIPDPDSPDVKNLFEDFENSQQVDYMRAHKGQHMKDVDPERYEQIVMESDALADAYRKAGVHVIRNETGKTPDEIVNWATGWGGPEHLSLYGQNVCEVFGHCLVETFDVTVARGTVFTFREAMLEMVMNDPEAVWLSMPFPTPSLTNPRPQPFMSPGDVRVFPDKTVIYGIGVPDPSYIQDRTKRRSSGDEIGAEVLRRMLEPHGWKVEIVYFNSRLTYHIDCLMCLVDVGLIGLPPNALWTPLPKAFADWEVIEVDVAEQQIGACNNDPLPDRKIAIVKGANKLAAELDRRGYTPVEIPYLTCYQTFGSGIHCSTAALWRED